MYSLALLIAATITYLAKLCMSPFRALYSIFSLALNVLAHIYVKLNETKAIKYDIKMSFGKMFFSFLFPSNAFRMQAHKLITAENFRQFPFAKPLFMAHKLQFQ